MSFVTNVPCAPVKGSEKAPFLYSVQLVRCARKGQWRQIGNPWALKEERQPLDRGRCFSSRPLPELGSVPGMKSNEAK